MAANTMNFTRLIRWITLLLFPCIAFYAKAQISSFNSSWKFHFGHASDATNDFNYSIAKVYDKTGKAKGTCIPPEYNDSGWQNIELPHDWAVALPFEYSANPDVEAHGYKPIGGLYPQNSIGWYRKSFDVSVNDSGKRISIRFDGMYRDSKVWVNGFYAGSNFSGYTGAQYDITDFIKWGDKNVVVVRADASQYEGWFYEGAGIYRNTWLIKQNNVHVAHNGVFIQTFGITKQAATVSIEATIENQNSDLANCTVSTQIVTRDGRIVGQSVPQAVLLNSIANKVIMQQIKIVTPHLWNLDDPYLYQAITIVKTGNKMRDEITTRFGIRTILIDNEKGLFLNGKLVKIKGVCCHQDHAGVGVAIPTHLQYYRIGLLKEMGVNAYRTSHNVPTPEVLDACDSLGLLVLDETRLLNSSNEYLNQFKHLILRDRNHPSVFMWSIGNEEEKAQSNSYGKRIAQSMMALQKELDPTRTCTYGANNGKTGAGINEVIPVRGVNYFLDEIDEYRNKRPLQPVIGTEVASTVTTRGIYRKDTANAYLPDHDITFPHWATTAEKWWQWADARPWFMGGFVWTGFDYRGEPTPFKWPNISSHFGIMDMCGFPKNNYYYYQAWWSDKKVLQLSPHWNHAGEEGRLMDVWVNSNAKEVELFLNDKSLGKKEMPVNGHLQWNVRYEPGIVKAIGYKEGRQWQTQMETTEKATQLVMEPDRTNIPAGAACIINITAMDNKGRIVPDADQLIEFSVEGNTRVLGIGNGDPSDHAPDQYAAGNNYKRKLFNGKCQLIITAGSSGTIRVQASSVGLKSAAIELKILQ